MRRVPVLCVLLSLATMPVPLAAGQDHHGASDQRGATVMGFDQAQTTHHFLLFADGGAIDVSVNDPSTPRTVTRSVLICRRHDVRPRPFDAPMLVHDSKNVPGTTVMTARKGVIRYQYVETTGGGRINIISDADGLSAVHAFLKFQIAEHKTGDPTTVRTR